MIDAKAKFERDYRVLERAWLDKVLVQPFSERVKGKPWEAAARKFVEANTSFVFGSPGVPWPAPETEAEQALNLLSRGCDDPLAVLVASHALYGVEERVDDAKMRLEAALEAAEASRMPVVLRRFIVMELLKLPHEEIKQKRGSLYEQVGQLTAEALAEGSYGPGDAEIFLRHIILEPWDRTLDQAPDVFTQVANSEQLPEWIQRTLKGHIEIERAWKARGGGWGYTVKEEGWNKFAEHLALARKELVRAWELRKDQPYAAAAMITVVMGGCSATGESERVWFDRATAAQFDFDPAYANYLWALRPRWGGSLRAVLAFGRGCRATNRYDTEVPRFFMRACNDIVKDLEGWESFYRSHTDPALAGEVLDHHRKLLAEPTREPLRWMDRSFLAVNAWLIADYAAAAEALKGLSQGRLHPYAVSKLQGLKLDEAAFRSEIASRVSGGVSRQ